MKVGTLITGLLLVLFGEIFFLINLGYGSWGNIYEISKYWPLLLIIIGLAMFWRGNLPRVLAYLVIILSVLTVGLYMIMEQQPDAQEIIVKAPLNISQQQYPEVIQGNLDIDYGGGKLLISPDTQDLLLADFGNRQIKQQIEANGQVLDINLSQNQFNCNPATDKLNHWQLKISPDLVWNLDIDAGAIDGKIDLTGIPLRQLNCNLGAGNILFTLGNNGVNSKMDIESGASNIKLKIVNDTGIRIKMNGALNSSNLEKLGWANTDGYYISPNYQQAASKIDCEIDLSLGNLEVEMQ